MTSRVAQLREQIECLEQEIVRISLEEEDAAKRAREEAAKAKAVRISEEPCKKSISLIDALDAAIDIGEDYIFATACVKRSEDKVAEYNGFATMSAYEAREILEENRAEAVDLQRKFFPSVHAVLVAMRESETERDQYLEKLGLEVARIKLVIGC
jgi:molecular chaperone GrpE (heat shock protein)